MKLNLPYIRLELLLFVVLFLPAGIVSAQDAVSMQRTTLMQHVITERPVLAQLLTTAGLVPVLSGSTDYTLLAPPEESLQSLKGQSVETIRAVLAMHIIKGKYKAADFKEGSRVQSYSGESLNICRKKGDTLLNGVKLKPMDKEMRNGVMHEMAGLLQP